MAEGLSRQQHIWRVTCFSVLGYEAIAIASRGRVPYVTHLVRRLPRPARFVVTVVIATIVHDHFDTQRIF